MADSNQYHHEPLQSQRSIRVFSLHPAWNRDSPIQGALSEIDLDSDACFEALSYVWGTPETSTTIEIVSATDGLQRASSLDVSSNCLSALQALRFQFRSRMLWIDAICIDQNSIPERNQQVRLMAEIYGKAKRVLIWLDPGQERKTQAHKALRLIRDIGTLCRFQLLRVFEEDEPEELRIASTTKLVVACEAYMKSKCRRLGDSFNAPFLNTYFQRVWTVQEIAMAHRARVYYGTRTTSWRNFVASALFNQFAGFLHNQESEIDMFRDAKTHWKLQNALESHFVLPDKAGLQALYDRRNKNNILNKLTDGTAELALIKSKGLDATDPKDKAYSMLWAFPDASEVADPLRQADYKKSIEEIYTEYTSAIVARMKGAPDIFYWVNSAQRNEALPSWVPDWKEDTPIFFYIWASNLRSFQAAKESSRVYKIELQGRLLSIWGIEQSKIRAVARLTKEVRQRDPQEPTALLEGLIDTADLVSSFTDVSKQLLDARGEEILERLYSVLRSQKELQDESSANEKQTEINLARRLNISIGLLRITVFDKLSFLLEATTINADPIEAALELYLSADEISSVIKEAQDLPNLPVFFALIIPLSSYIDLYQFLNEVFLHHQDKDFFLTDKDNMGIAFWGLSDDCTIAIWKGCPSPMVVRKVEEDEQVFYQLHGPAYVDGIMNGEAWVESDDDLQVFNVL